MEYTASNDVIEFICQHVEGNLLAAMQETEKIALLCDSKTLDMQTIQMALADNSHYTLNQLIEAVSQKNTSRVIRILNTLEKEDFSQPLIIWGLVEQIRKLIDTKSKYLSNKNNPHLELLKRLCIVHQQGIGIFNDNGEIKTSSLLKQCAWTDRVVKGRASSNPWREILQLTISENLAA